SDGTGKYYLVKVVAKDPAGNASTATDVKVYVTNDTADDQNAPPQIGGVPATPTTVVTIKDTATATPFSNVTITDDSTVTVLVSLDNKAKGTLVGEGFAWVDALQAYKFEGSAAAAQTAIKNLVFTPTARPNGAVNAAEDTTFTISVSDNVNPAVTNSTIRVRSEVENRAPILVAAAYNPTILHSENINLVNPFKDVSIGETNAGDMVTVTITLDDFAKGDLKNLNDFVRNENAKTYTFIGSAADAQVKIRALQYDPRDRPGSAASEVTSFTISVQDNHQDTATVTNTNIKVTSLGVNSAPTGLTLGANSVKEYSLAGQEIGTLAATDVNGDALTYKLLDNAGGRFAIVNNKLVLAGPGVNFEEAASHQVKIQVSDGRGGTTEQVFTVNVLDETTLNKKGTKKNDKLNGGLLDDILKGGTGNGRDTIKGLAGDDKLYGENGNDSILGGDGIDRLYGGNQDDILKGDAGNDFLYGEAGIDKLYGGLGKDTFIFNKKPSKTANLDKIMDFNVADDTIWLENSVFKKLGKAGSEAMPAVLNAVNFVIGSKAKDRDDFIIYNNKKGILYYDADGSGKGAAVEIASMKKNLKLTIDDFKII
ncbi:Ig-like domain-containing protein, partial [Microvirga sp. CF3016]|uniref:Ig-like domain-containing protein n=1 Tax=Microvirga sp. CF3016 TaxID=3110181 RepID=UPI002EAC59A4|nr:hypothetical protein [Microvirga sp. CF3016]